jgi:hypothetical protein
MKTIGMFVIFMVIASFSWPADWETYEVVNRLLTIHEPCAPVVLENTVIFTADSSLRKVGVAFAHENFANTYWFQRILVSQDFLDPIILPGQKTASPYKDSGIQFYVYQFPDNLKELEYRLVINGLWIIDPTNPQTRRDTVSGLTMSVLTLPARPVNYSPVNTPAGLKFSFKGPPGETVTVAGSFNGWDPFMYELKESPAGIYSIAIPLPPGIYQYIFFHRGQRYTDPYNARRVYSRDGTPASEIVIP